MTHHHQQFALIQTSGGAVVLAVDDISHAIPFDTPPGKRLGILLI